MQRPGTGASISDVVVVGQLLSLDGDGVGHVVHQMDAGKGVGRAVQPLLIAHYGITAVAGIAVHASHLVAVLQQHGENVILSGDGSTVAPHQAVVDGDGVGLGAVLVLGLLVAGDYGVVVDELAFLGEHHSVIAAMDQLVHVVVGLGGGEPGVIKLVDDLGDGADDQLASGLGGFFTSRFGAQI
ncbi:unknown [Clostridium sp. CAG:1013]|nr:unknown [Clostridium sp. CAG:1013]